MSVQCKQKRTATSLAGRKSLAREKQGERRLEEAGRNCGMERDRVPGAESVRNACPRASHEDECAVLRNASARGRCQSLDVWAHVRLPSSKCIALALASGVGLSCAAVPAAFTAAPAPLPVTCNAWAGVAACRAAGGGLASAPRLAGGARLRIRAAAEPDGCPAGEDMNAPRAQAWRAATEGTTWVPTENGKLVEVGCINTKRDFLVGEHLLGKLPEHAPAGLPLGHVTLVGAGPGDPDLLTMAAHKALAAADVVVADRLVSQEILELVQGDLKVARKLPGCALEAQREIYQWCAEAVLQGKQVVRLKIGDPYVFGRGGEEVLELRRLGLEPTVLPGISSALAGPLAAGIPVTHRGVANRVVFCTGMSKEETVPDVPVFHAEQTCVFLMAVGRLPELVHALRAADYPAHTPVGIIERATTPRERTLRSDLDGVVAAAAAAQVQPPAIVVVGGVVNALHDPRSATAAVAAMAGGDGDDCNVGLSLMPEELVAAVWRARGQEKREETEREARMQ